MMELDKKLKKSIIKAKRKEVRHMREAFDTGLLRNAAFSVGTQFSSANVSLQQDLPVAVPLLSKFPVKKAEIENYRPFLLMRALEPLNLKVFFVATDREFLGGDPSHINLVKTGSEISAVMRDFIVSEEQIYQAKAMGADGIYLDPHLCEPGKLAEWAEIAFQMGMEPFLEIHEPADLEGVEPEILGGVIIDRAWVDRHQGTEADSGLAGLRAAGVPVLLRHTPRSAEEVLSWREKGISFFLLAEDWLLAGDPVGELRKIAEIFSQANNGN